MEKTTESVKKSTFRNYNLLFEELVLTAWGVSGTNADPFKLGDANTLDLVYNDLNNDQGHDVKFALSTALRKVAAEHADKQRAYEDLMNLNTRVWKAKTYSDFCFILQDVKSAFTNLSMTILN